ncbi:TonB-dependent receptor [Rhizobium sp. C1]|uniref:TonB-dependent receptor n=1 Tax=Rhizobium sp. C1 TaxID=1349799 RepID=UPI001E4126BF|nr:TonB-dependent receptor [Rhizobium sp. C1]MCD2179541.1 TonB-dependent receptor [Rhizobium sp. C1]
MIKGRGVRVLLWTSVSLTALTSGAVAQENQAGQGAQTPATSLQAIVVTGSRSPQQISDTAQTIYVVDSKEIASEARSGKSLQQILADKVPSFDPASVGSRTSYGQNLRGRTALILIDGVSMNSARSLSRQFDSIDPFNIERVEVLSGATSIYGGNATGGIINIITKKGKDAEQGFHAEVTGGLGSGFGGSNDLDSNVGAAVTYNSDAWDGRLSISGNKTGAFYGGGGKLLIPDITQTSTAFNQRLDLMGSVGFQIDDNRRLELSGQYFDSKQESDYGLFYGLNFAALAKPSLFETRPGYKSDFNPQTTRSMFNVTYTDDDFLGQKLLLQGAFRSERLKFNPFPSSSAFTGAYFAGSSQDTDYYSVKAALVSEPLDSLKITYGIDADRDSFSSRQNVFDTLTAARTGGMNFRTMGITGLYPTIDVSTVAGFVEASYEATDRLTISGGLRYQFVNTKVSNFVGAAQQVAILQGRARSAASIPGGEVNYDALLVNAGATYELGPDQQIYGNFSQGFELPDPAKYYGVGSYVLSGGVFNLVNSVNVSSSALQAIKTNSVEFGYRLDDGKYNLEAAAFYSFSDKSIQLNRSTLAVDVVNRDRRVYGIEGTAGVKFDNGFNVGVLGQWVQTEVKGKNGWVNDTVGTASVSKLGGYVGWTNDALSLRLSGQHVFSLTDADNFKIDGYTLFDLAGSYTFENSKTTLNFGVQNVFDTQYTTVWGSRAKALYGALADKSVFDYKGRGRTFAVSLTKVF